MHQSGGAAGGEDHGGLGSGSSRAQQVFKHRKTGRWVGLFGTVCGFRQRRRTSGLVGPTALIARCVSGSFPPSRVPLLSRQERVGLVSVGDADVCSCPPCFEKGSRISVRSSIWLLAIVSPEWLSSLARSVVVTRSQSGASGSVSKAALRTLLGTASARYQHGVAERTGRRGRG